MDGMLAAAAPSVSSVYGNVLAAMRHYLVSRFPPHFFKYVTETTEFAYFNMRRQLGGTNSRIEMRKRGYPQFIIQPVFQEPERGAFMQGIPLTSNFDNLQMGVDKRYMMTLIKDQKYGYNLNYKINRDHIEFECRLVMSTLHQQIDVYKYLQNTLVWERPFSRITSLECVIPRTLITYIGKLCEMDINERPYMIPALIRRMNTMASNPITYKLRTASASDEFFVYYDHTAIITLYDLHIDDGQRKAMVDDHYDITFRLSIDFNLPGLFAITGNLEKMNGLKAQLIVQGNPPSDPTSEEEKIPLFTIRNIYNEYPPEMGDFILTAHVRFTCTNTSSMEPELMDLSALFLEEQRKIVQFYTEYNLPPENIFKLYLLKDDEKLEPGTDFNIRWFDLQLEILHPDRFATYRAILYVNHLTLNGAMADVVERQAVEKSPLRHFPIDYHKRPEDPYKFLDKPPAPHHVKIEPDLGKPPVGDGSTQIPVYTTKAEPKT